MSIGERLRSRSDMLRRWLDRLDALPPVRFTVALYLLRWLAIAPLMIMLPSDASSETMERLRTMHVLDAAVGLLIGAPLFETLIECLLPYLVLQLALRRTRYAGCRRHWPFIALSALIMVAVHPLEPRTITATAITGSFLAYTFAHFAPTSRGRAFLATSVFHAAINLVGFAKVLSTRG